MKILVTGAAGMLGTSLVPVLKEQGHEVYPTDIDTRDPGIDYLDVRDWIQVSKLARNGRPDVIAHLAAKTDVELCEVEREDAHLTNTIGTENVARMCSELGIPMVYTSTAGVFDGRKKEPYVESDTPNPVNFYGRTKLEGEEVIPKILEKYFIVRAGWMMGSGPAKDKKFVAKVVRQLDAGVQRLYAVTDKIGTPTYTVDFSKCLANLISTPHYGLYHLVSKGRGTRYDVAREILQILKRRDVELVPVDSDFFAKEYFAPRPKSEMLRNQRLKSLGMDMMRHWKDALEEYLRKEFPDRSAKLDQ